MVKNLLVSAGDIRGVDLSPRLGRFPAGAYGISVQYSCLGNSMDRGPWWAVVHRISKSQTRLKQFSTHPQELF